MSRAPRSDEGQGDVVEWTGGLSEPIPEPSAPLSALPVAVLTIRDSAGACCFIGYVTAKWRFHYAHDWLRSAIANAERRGAALPTRLRVNDRELAVALAGKVHDVQILIDPSIAPAPPTPHTDPSFEEEADRSYFGVDVQERDVAAFFSAAAELQRRDVWEHLPIHGPLFELSVDTLAAWDKAVCILQITWPPALYVFDTAPDFERYLDSLRAMSRGDDGAPMPPHLQLAYSPLEDLSDRAQSEIATHGWELAGPRFAPWLAAVLPDHGSMPETRRQALLVQAAARALGQLVGDLGQARSAWSGQIALDRTLALDLGGGPVEARVRAPCRGPAGPLLPKLELSRRPS